MNVNVNGNTAKEIGEYSSLLMVKFEESQNECSSQLKSKKISTIYLVHSKGQVVLENNYFIQCVI